MMRLGSSGLPVIVALALLSVNPAGAGVSGELGYSDEMSSSCLDDCEVRSIPYAGGTTLLLHRVDTVVGSMWVGADLGDDLRRGPVSIDYNGVRPSVEAADLRADCGDDCFVDAVDYGGGTLLYLRKGDWVVDSAWVPIEVAEAFEAGSLAPSAKPPVFGDEARNLHAAGTNGGESGDWQVTVVYRYARQRLNALELKTRWWPAASLD